jgi:hypothetical protein
MSVARRSLQVVAFICTLIVGVTSMAVIVTQTTWFKEWLRGFIVRQAEDYVNGKLTIGRLEGNLFSGIELGDIDIRQNGKTVVNVGEVGVQYNPLTLIKGDVVLDHIRVDRPKLLAERTAQGWNLATLIKTKTPDRPNNKRTIEIGEIGISDGTLDIVDAVGTSGADVPEHIDRLDASVAVRSDADALQVDVAHVSFRAQGPQIGLNALSGTIRQTKNRVDFENVSVRTEESSLRVNGSVANLESTNPMVDVTASSDKFAFTEIAKLIPALRGYDLQPAFEVSAKGPADRLAVKMNVREATLGGASGDLTVDALDPERRIAGTVALQHFNVAPIAKNPNLKSDITGQARIDMALTSGRLPLSGTYQVNADHVAIAGYQADDVVANGRIDGNTIRVNASAAAYGGHATARGTVKTGPQLALDLSGRASNLDLRNLPPQVKAPGVPSNLQLDYTVSGRGPVYSGDVTLGTSTLAGATIAQGTTGHFRVGAGAPSYAAKGQVASLDVQQVGRGFGITALAVDRYRSSINATFDVSGSGGGAYPLTLDATGTATNSELFGASFARLDFTTNIAGGSAHVKAAGDFAHLNPAVVSGNDRVAGSLNGQLDVDTTIRDYAAGIRPESIDAAGHVALSGSRIAGIDIDSATIDGQFANRVGNIDALSIMGADLAVTGHGPLVLDESGNSNLELHLETPSLAKVGTLAGQDNLTGGAVVDATVSGNARKLTVWGNVHGSNVGQGDNNALALDSTFDVTIPNLDAAAMTAHAQTTATFVELAGQRINGMYADTTYGNQLLQFSVDAKQEQRQLDAGGEVVFHTDHQEIHLPELILRSQQIEWRTPANAMSSIQYSKDRIAVQNVELVSGDQRIVANGVVGGSAAEPLKVQASNVDVAQLNQLALGQPGEIAGRLTANATVSGPTSAPRVAGDFTLTQGAFRMFTFESLGGTVDYAQPGVNLDVKLQQNATQWLTAKGYAPVSLFRATPPEMRDTHTSPAAGESIDLQVESSPIDLGIIQGFTSYVSNVTGTLQANFKVGGSGYDPHLDGAIEVHNGAFELPDLGTSYTGFDTRIDLAPDTVKISEMKIVDNHGSPMTVGGQLAVHGRELGGVEVTLQATDFKVIDNKMGNVRLDTNLRLTGEVRAPRLEGSVDVNTGWLDVAEILAQTTTDAYSTKATELPKVEPATAEDKVLQNAEIAADADTKRPGSGADTAPNTTQAVKKTDAEQPVATTAKATPPVLDRLDLDLAFGVPSDLVLKGRDLKASSGGVSLGDVNVTVGGAVQVRKEPGDVMRLRGEVTTVRGNYTFQGRRFDIQRNGRIRFVGNDVIDPLLDLEAHRTIQAVEAIVRVRGTMRQPELSFRSNPPLEEADVLSLIVFNQPINELGEGQQASLAQRAGDLAGGYLASGLARSIGSALNLNEFELQAAGENGLAPSVTVGQQVGKNLFFRIRQAFGSAQATEFILEYQLADFLRLQATAAETSGGTQRIQFRRVERGGLDLIFFFSY